MNEWIITETDSCIPKTFRKNNVKINRNVSESLVQKCIDLDDELGGKSTGAPKFP